MYYSNDQSKCKNTQKNAIIVFYIVPKCFSMSNKQLISQLWTIFFFTYYRYGHGIDNSKS